MAAEVLRIQNDREFTHAEAADYLGVKPKTLSNWLCSGRGPRNIIRYGRRYYSQKDLDAYRKSREEIQEAYS
jgi:hypothetical protein